MASCRQRRSRSGRQWVATLIISASLFQSHLTPHTSKCLVAASSASFQTVVLKSGCSRHAPAPTEPLTAGAHLHPKSSGRPLSSAISFSSQSLLEFFAQPEPLNRTPTIARRPHHPRDCSHGHLLRLLGALAAAQLRKIPVIIPRVPSDMNRSWPWRLGLSF